MFFCKRRKCPPTVCYKNLYRTNIYDIHQYLYWYGSAYNPGYVKMYSRSIGEIREPIQRHRYCYEISLYTRPTINYDFKFGMYKNVLCLCLAVHGYFVMSILSWSTQLFLSTFPRFLKITSKLPLTTRVVRFSCQLDPFLGPSTFPILLAIEIAYPVEFLVPAWSNKT